VRLIEWYRLDIAGGLRRTLVVAATSMACGSAVIGLSFLARQSQGVRIAAAVLGFAAIVGGPLLAFFGLRRSLSDDRYLAIVREGVLLHLETEQLWPWDDLERVRFEAALDTIVFAFRNGREERLALRFLGITNAQLAERLDAARRKAGFDLLAR
jgi:hypothetical protein